MLRRETFRHRRNGFHHAPALANEHRQDQVFGEKPRLAHEAPREVVATRAAHAPVGKTPEAGGHFRSGKKAGTLAWGVAPIR
jgi:hypothetical protein